MEYRSAHMASINNDRSRYGQKMHSIYEEIMGPVRVISTTKRVGQQALPVTVLFPGSNSLKEKLCWANVKADTNDASVMASFISPTQFQKGLAGWMPGQPFFIT